jgi:predicted CXXCH cytochrome family protein
VRLPVLLAVAAALAVSAPGGAAAEGDAAAVLGSVQLACALCHMDRAGAAAEGEIDFRTLRSGEAGSWRLCYSCHSGAVVDFRQAAWEGFQHVTEVRLRRDGGGTSSFPADRAGNLFCGTCHTPHVRGPGIGVFMRFASQEGANCRSCHPGMGGTGDHPVAGARSAKNAPSCDRCHRIHGAPASFLLTRSPWGTQGLCQDCHGVRTGAEGTADHPVNVKVVRKSAMPWSREGLALSPGGTVDCWSCHRVHGGVPGTPLVIREMTEAAACGRCHEEQAARGKGNHPVGASGKGDAAPVTCRSCHRVHKAAGAKALLSYDPTAGDACGGCHAPMKEAGNHPLAKVQRSAMVDRLAAEGGSFAPGDRMICSSCHRVHRAAPDTRGLIVESRRLCLYCHEKQNAIDPAMAAPGSHPIFVPVKKGLPPALKAGGGKLGPKGELICVSCHRAHRGNGKTMLVVEREILSCRQCHPDPKYAGSSSHGKGGGDRDGCRRCHGEHGWVVRSGANDGDDGKDAISRVCRSCHRDGGTASSTFQQGISHPLGMAVKEMKGKPLPLFLEDGRAYRAGNLACATCHDAHADATKKPKLLRYAADGDGGLCLVCHPGRASVSGTDHDLRLTAPGETNIAGRTAGQQGVCSPCHMVHGAFDEPLWARLPEGDPELKDRLCLSCHNAAGPAREKVPGPFSHSTGASLPTARSATPERLSCVTCHDPHRWDPLKEKNRQGPDGEGDLRNSFLRRPDDAGSSLCLSCHPDRTMAGTRHDFRKSKMDCVGESATLCGRCHLVHAGEGELGWPENVDADGDTASALCRTCHTPGGCTPKAAGRLGHPVGVAAYARETGKLPLFDNEGRAGDSGLVSCPTCHRLHNPRESGNYLLRLRADGHSPLCAVCHDTQNRVAGTDHDLRVTAPKSANRQKKPPSASGVCGVCHAVHDPVGGYALWNREVGTEGHVSNRLCTGCHRDKGLAVPPERLDPHRPTGGGEFFVNPRKVRRTGATLQLYGADGLVGGSGYITCLTCHDPHQWDPGQPEPGPGTPQEGGVGNSFLRVTGNLPLRASVCADCHPEETPDFVRRYHVPVSAPR